MGQPRDEARSLFVKFDAWSAVELALIRQTFPGVPWLFLFRDPVEVLVSQTRLRGAHVIPGALPARTLGLTALAACEIPPVEYAARVLARVGQAALEFSDDARATFVDHADLPGFVLDRLPSAWSLTLSEEDVDRMGAAAVRDAKNPSIPFEPDREQLRAAATVEILAAAEQWLAPVHERMLGTRAAHRAGWETPCGH